MNTEPIFCDCGSGHHWIGGFLFEPDPKRPPPPRPAPLLSLDTPCTVTPGIQNASAIAIGRSGKTKQKAILYTSAAQLEADGFSTKEAHVALRREEEPEPDPPPEDTPDPFARRLEIAFGVASTLAGVEDAELSIIFDLVRMARRDTEAEAAKKLDPAVKAIKTARGDPPDPPPSKDPPGWTRDIHWRDQLRDLAAAGPFKAKAYEDASGKRAACVRGRIAVAQAEGMIVRVGNSCPATYRSA